MRDLVTRRPDTLQHSPVLTIVDLARGLATMNRRACALLLCWGARSSQRRHLRELAAPLLTDVGLTREDVHREGSKYFWQH